MSGPMTDTRRKRFVGDKMSSTAIVFAIVIVIS